MVTSFESLLNWEGPGGLKGTPLMSLLIDMVMTFFVLRLEKLICFQLKSERVLPVPGNKCQDKVTPSEFYEFLIAGIVVFKFQRFYQ